MRSIGSRSTRNLRPLYLALAMILGFNLLTPTIGWTQTRSPRVQEGYALLERGWVNDAITVFQQALRSTPQSLDARLGLAIAYQRAGQDANAWSAYQQVLSQDPQNRTALAAVGLLGGYRPEWQRQGIEALTTLLTLQPDNRQARAQRALLHGYQGDFAAAIADYEQVLPTNPEAAVVLEAAQVYTYSGDVAQGLALFRRYLAINPTLPIAAVPAYARALQETGDVAAAIEVLQSRLHADTNATEIRTALATAYAANNQPEQALEVLEPLRGQNNAALPLARALSTIGRQSRDVSLTEEAVALYRQVLQSTASPTPGLLTEIADVWSELPASSADALALYDQLAAQDPQNQSLQVKQRLLRYQLGQIGWQELHRELQQVLQPLPTALPKQRAIAQALIRLDSPDPALQPIYEQLLAAGVPFLQFRIAQMELRQNESAAARQALAAYRATAVGSQDPAAELLLAEIERQEGNLEASARRYATIAEQTSQPAIRQSALRGLAGIRLAQQQPEAALAIYQQLRAEEPQNLALTLGEAAVAYTLQQLSLSEAEAILEQGLAQPLSPNSPPELFLLVGALPPAAERAALYDQILSIQPDQFAVNRRWVQYWAGRDPQRAEARVADLLSQYPDSVAVYFLQGELAQTLGNLDQASDAYTTILARQPQNPDALAALAGVRFQQRRYADATRLYQQVLALKPNDPETRRLLAELQAAQDQRVTALQELQELQQQPATSDAQMHQRLQDLKIDFLQRRGFQPSWERY
ncbi:MAG: tetratricopeptide repeat protein [Synechococcales cyanobacterium M58_A2018_015]|nr:tetratricopeptide repeat protein [Synechococcales cyanobacterium M58_A2018_015]